MEQFIQIIAPVADFTFQVGTIPFRVVWNQLTSDSPGNVLLGIMITFACIARLFRTKN